MRAWEEHVVRRNLLVALAVLTALTLGLLAWPGIVQAEENVSFGIKPAKAHESNPKLPSYFTHTLAPGALMADEALVVNSGDVPITLKLYAADGTTAINGGTGFANDGEEKNGVARWLSLPMSELSLQPGETKVMPFLISVPSDASPGQHVAGLVLEAATSSAAPTRGSADTRFTVNVVRRAGVAVLIDVPGPHVAGLEITGVCLRQQDKEQGATFEVAVRNTGNVFVRGQGSLVIRDREGTEFASIPIQMDTVLAGDATHFQVTHPARLSDGSYLLSVVLDYAEGQTAILEGADLNLKHGQPEVGCEPEESKPPEPGLAPDITTLTPAQGEGGPPIGRYAVYSALVALVLAALAVVVVRRLRTRRLRRPGPAPHATTLTPVQKKGGTPAGRHVAYGAGLLALLVAAPAVVLVRRAGTRRLHHR